LVERVPTQGTDVGFTQHVVDFRGTRIIYAALVTMVHVLPPLHYYYYRAGSTRFPVSSRYADAASSNPVWPGQHRSLLCSISQYIKFRQPGWGRGGGSPLAYAPSSYCSNPNSMVSRSGVVIRWPWQCGQTSSSVSTSS